ncbi:MAG: hypothetical protein WBL72_05630 [Thermoguttaceae bacterium]
MTKSTRSAKPAKPRPDFPLFPHATGRWAKKVRGQLHYFGKTVGDEKGRAALERWLDQKDDLLAGRTPRVKGGGLTVRDLCNNFLRAKKPRLETGELAARSFADLHATCKRLGDAFGWNRLVVDLAADDFDQLRSAVARQWGPARLGGEVRRIRAVFKYGTAAGLIQAPVQFGPNFTQPSQKVMRTQRAKKGSRMLEAAELRRVLEIVKQPLRAMILLGINCGFGNADCAELPLKSLDLKAGWVNFPRPKTGIARRCPLWPETVAALAEAIANRPDPRDKAHAGLVFLTRFGRPWRVNELVLSESDSDGAGETKTVKIRQDDPIAKEFTKILKALKLHRPGLGFYGLRRGLETIGGDTGDQVAVDLIMGHVPAANDMAAVYRQRVSDARLVAVTEHVRKWLFGEEAK